MIIFKVGRTFALAAIKAIITGTWNMISSVWIYNKVSTHHSYMEGMGGRVCWWTMMSCCKLEIISHSDSMGVWTDAKSWKFTQYYIDKIKVYGYISWGFQSFPLRALLRSFPCPFPISDPAGLSTFPSFSLQSKGIMLLSYVYDFLESRQSA